MIQAPTTASMRKPPREKSTDAVYQKIRAKILANEFRPGMQLLEQELVQLFGVSRTPVREALIRLQKENLLQIVPRHGMRVRHMSLADIEEVHQVQTSLEATAAGLVASRKPRAKDLRPLDAACADMQRAFAKGDLEAWGTADDAFYAHLLHLADNPRLTQVVNECWNQLRGTRSLALRAGVWPDWSVDGPRAIVDALRSGERAAAEAACRASRAKHLQVQIAALKRLGVSNG